MQTRRKGELEKDEGQRDRGRFQEKVTNINTEFGALAAVRATRVALCPSSSLTLPPTSYDNPPPLPLLLSRTTRDVQGHPQVHHEHIRGASTPIYVGLDGKRGERGAPPAVPADGSRRSASPISLSFVNSGFPISVLSQPLSPRFIVPTRARSCARAVSQTDGRIPFPARDGETSLLRERIFSENPPPRKEYSLP